MRSLWFRLRAWWIFRGYDDLSGRVIDDLLGRPRRGRTREWTPEEHAAFFQRLMAEGRRRGLLAPDSPTCDQPKET